MSLACLDQVPLLQTQRSKQKQGALSLIQTVCTSLLHQRS